MIRLLDGLVLLKEIDEIDGEFYTSKYFRENHNEDLVFIRRVAYIYAHALPSELRSRVTLLDDYIPIGELASYASIQKCIFDERFKFMKHTGEKLFDYIVLGGIRFIQLDQKFKHLLQNYQAFHATLQDYDLKHVHVLGDIKIGFY